MISFITMYHSSLSVIMNMQQDPTCMKMDRKATELGTHNKGRVFLFVS